LDGKNRGNAAQMPVLAQAFLYEIQQFQWRKGQNGEIFIPNWPGFK